MYLAEQQPSNRLVDSHSTTHVSQQNHMASAKHKVHAEQGRQLTYVFIQLLILQTSQD